MKITHETLFNKNFISGMRKIVETPLQQKVGYKASRIFDLLVKETKTASDYWRQQIAKIPDVVESEKGKQLEQDFLALEIDLGKWEPLNIQDIAAVMLTPMELSALKPILTGLETLEGGEHGKESNEEKSC